MIYYHYTTQHGAFHIAHSGKILKGQGALADGSAIAPQLGVNLTTSPSCIGHGLHLGQKLSATLIQTLPSTVWVKRNPQDLADIHLLEHSAYRLEVELESDDYLLQSATDYYKHNPRLLKTLALTGHNPLFDYLTEREKNHYLFAFLNGELQDMSSTWYYYFDDIVASKIKSISRASSFDVYSQALSCAEWLELWEQEANLVRHCSKM